jgi:transcriptional regulator GlxA family with amidase domain
MALTLLHEQPQARDAPAAARALALAPPAARLRRALDFIEAHAASPIGLADIAEAAHLSVSSLLRHFSRHTGRTPHAYLRSVRLARARDALRREPELSVREVASRWGFQNASKFSGAYLKEFGERPTQTRDATA